MAKKIAPDDCKHDQGAMYTFGWSNDIMTGEEVEAYDSGGFRCNLCGLLIKKAE